MKIIYLHQYFNTPNMAGGTRSYEMARRLVAAGHEVEMVTSWREPTNKSDWFVTKEEGIRVHWLPNEYSNAMSYSTRIRKFMRFAVKASRRAKALTGDVVFATSTPLTIAIPGAYASITGRMPMVFEVRDLWPTLPIAVGALRNPVSKWFARRLEAFAYSNATHIVALSPGMAQGVSAAGFPRERITVIPNACDLDLFKPNDQAAIQFRSKYPELGDGPIVLYAGTLGHINRVDYIVHVAAHVNKQTPEVRFVIIGSGAEHERIRQLADDLGVLGRNVFMYPRVPKEQVASAYAAASVALSLFDDIPEMESNSANKFFDALSAGVAVAINYSGWQAELLRESGAGVVLPRKYIEAANVLVQLLRDKEQVLQAGRNARALAETQFDRDTLAKALEDVLTKVVTDWNGRAPGAGHRVGLPEWRPLDNARVTRSQPNTAVTTIE